MATISKTLLVEEQKTYELEINLRKTYNLIVDLYSAAADTVSFTDDNGAQTVTTDATGKATGVNITITQPSQGVDPTITFTSSVAKNPSNQSNNYSKTITVNSETTAIYIMPDHAYYWYGNEMTATTGGWVKTGYRSYDNYTNTSDKGYIKNTNNIYADGTSGANMDMPVLGVQNLLSLSGLSKIKILCNITAVVGNIPKIMIVSKKDPCTYNQIAGVKPTVGTSLSFDISATSAYLCIQNYFATDNRFIGHIYAIYGE